MAYNDYIVIQQRTDARDEYGELDPTWSTYKSLWGEKADDGGYLEYSADMPVFAGSLTFRIHTHDAPAVTTKMRISYDSKYYSIRNITTEGRLHTMLSVEAFDDE